jgi:hypothetical protein
MLTLILAFKGKCEEEGKGKRETRAVLPFCPDIGRL